VLQPAYLTAVKIFPYNQAVMTELNKIYRIIVPGSASANRGFVASIFVDY
jgi:hypothetical protein